MSFFVHYFYFKFVWTIFSTKKYPIPLPPHRLRIYACIPTTEAPHTTAPQSPRPTTNVFFCPLFLFQICLNYFFHQKISHTSPSASIQHPCQHPRTSFHAGCGGGCWLMSMRYLFYLVRGTVSFSIFNFHFLLHASNFLLRYLAQRGAEDAEMLFAKPPH